MSNTLSFDGHAMDHRRSRPCARQIKQVRARPPHEHGYLSDSEEYRPGRLRQSWCGYSGKQSAGIVANMHEIRNISGRPSAFFDVASWK